MVLLLPLCSSTRRAGSLWHLQDLVGVNHRAGSPRLCINAQTFVRAFRFLPVKLAASGSKLRFITVQFGASFSDSRAWFRERAGQLTAHGAFPIITRIHPCSCLLVQVATSVLGRPRRLKSHSIALRPQLLCALRIVAYSQP